jgi:hypothetical protein
MMLVKHDKKLFPPKHYMKSAKCRSATARASSSTATVWWKRIILCEMFGFPRLKTLLVRSPDPSLLIDGLLGQLKDFADTGWEQESS